ncbi:MAG: hypothetical protein PQJ59_16610 [Spirochaetales bacterium]|nr:hypothetical protein [Spirochaetales bacterium]
MQFFIIHEDPKTNAAMLPDYALKQVNIREGWQILSDIGHNLGITWECQNKAYSIWHAETRRFMVNRISFYKFIFHYSACLNEYEKRFKKTTVFHLRFDMIDGFGGAIKEIGDKLPMERSHEEFMRDYMLKGKIDKLRPEEIERLEGMYD